MRPRASTGKGCAGAGMVPRAGRGAGFQGVEDHAGRGDPFGGGVELGGQAAGGQVGLGGQDQDGEARLQAQAAVQHPQAHGDRHHGHGDRGGEFQHQGGEEGDAQRAHGLPPVPVGQGGESGDRVAAAAEHLEGGQGAQRVEEPGTEVGEGLPAAGDARPGGPAHQGAEHGDQRQGDQDDGRRQRVQGEHPAEHEGRRRHRQGQLREVAGEVGVEGLDAPAGRRGQGPGPPSGALGTGHARQQGTAQGRLHPGGAVVGGDLGRPGHEGRGGSHPGQAGEPGPQAGRALAGEAPGHETSEQESPGDGQAGPGEAEDHRRRQEDPGAPPQPEQTPVDEAGAGRRRGQPVGDSCSRVTRLRNTQYDHAW